MKWFVPVVMMLTLAGCGSTGFFDGTWELVDNNCSPDIDFAGEVNLDQTGSTAIIDEIFAVYKVTAVGEEDTNALISEADADVQEFLLCLDPDGETDPEACLQLCAGGAMDNEITFYCDFGMDFCGPVTYGRVL